MVALVAGVVERVAMRPMVGEPTFSAAIVTIGVFYVLQVFTAKLIGSGQRGVGDPWGLQRFDVGGVTVFDADVVRIAAAAATVAALAAFFRYSRWGPRVACDCPQPRDRARAGHCGRAHVRAVGHGWRRL